MRIHFVSAVGGSAFMAELLEVIARSVADAGGTVDLFEGPFPRAPDGDIFVVVPHEYFVVTPPDDHPTPDQIAHTIGFCVEHPRASSEYDTFGVSTRWAARLGGNVDINKDSLEAMHRLGIEARPFVLGYSPLWDTWNGDLTAERPVDITYMGTTDRRRNRVLGQMSDYLWQWNTRLLIPPHEPMTRPRPDFLMGSNKHRHLAHSKILLNLHRGESQSLEWVRVLEAMCNGCVVVSESSVDFAPLVPNEHIVFGKAQELGGLANELLSDPERLDRVRDNGYAFIKSTLDMHESGARLLEMARKLAQSVPGSIAEGSPLTGVSSTRVSSRLDPDTASVINVKKLEATSGNPFVDVLITSVPGDPTPQAALKALAGQTFKDFRVLLCDARGDANADEGVVPVDGIDIQITKIAASPLGEARGFYQNHLLNRSTSDHLLVIDSGHVCYPTALERLVAAISEQPTTSAVYPFVAEGDGQLNNLHMLEGIRIARTPYVGGAFLIRRADLLTLGGFPRDQGTDQEQYQKFWLDFARQGLLADLLPQILVRFQPNWPVPSSSSKGWKRWGNSGTRKLAGGRING